MTGVFSNKLKYLKAGMAQGRVPTNEQIFMLFEDMEGLLFDLDVRLEKLELVKPPPYMEPRGV